MTLKTGVMAAKFSFAIKINYILKYTQRCFFFHIISHYLLIFFDQINAALVRKNDYGILHIGPLLYIIIIVFYCCKYVF